LFNVTSRITEGFSCSNSLFIRLPIPSRLSPAASGKYGNRFTRRVTLSGVCLQQLVATPQQVLTNARKRQPLNNLTTRSCIFELLTIIDTRISRAGHPSGPVGNAIQNT